MNLFGDPYSLQGGGGNLTGGQNNLQGGYSPQQVYGPVPAVQPRGAAPVATPSRPVVTAQPAVAPRPVSVPPHIAGRDTQINSIFSPYIDSRPSASNPGVLEYYNKQTGQGFGSAQELYNFASQLGAGSINSFDQLHAPVNQTFNPQVQNTQPASFDSGRSGQSVAQNAGYANLSPDEYTKIVQQQNALTPDEIAQIRGGLGIDQLEQTVFQPPSQNTQDTYNSAYSAAGLGDVKAKILALNDQVNTARQQFTDAQGNVNENPFLSEASRVGRISRLQDKSQQQITNLLEYQKQYQDLYQQGLNEVNGLVTRHTNDFTQQQSLNAQKLQYLLSKAEQQGAATVAQKNQASLAYLPDYLKAKVKGQNPQTVTAPNGAIFNYNRTTGTFDMVQSPTGNFDVNPVTGDLYSKNTGTALGAGTNYGAGLSFNTGSTNMRTDRNNNPTAFTTDVAKTMGLIEGVDYVRGDKFPGNSNLYTAKLLGDPIAITIKGIDKAGFTTASGQPRWSYLSSIPDAKNWANLSYDQKAKVVAQMYQHEGGNGSLVQSSGGGAGSGNVLDTTAQKLVDGTIDPNQISERTPGYLAIIQRADAYSQQKYGIPFDIATAQQNFNARQKGLDQNATTFRPIQLAQQTALSHLDELDKLAKAVNFGDIPAYNDARIYTSDHVKSDQNIKNLQSTINIIRGEVAKVLGGGTPTVESLNEAQSVLPMNIPYSQLQGVIQKVKTLMKEKVDQLNRTDNIPQLPTGRGLQMPTSGSGGSNLPPLSSYNL